MIRRSFLLSSSSSSSSSLTASAFLFSSRRLQHQQYQQQARQEDPGVTAACKRKSGYQNDKETAKEGKTGLGGKVRKVIEEGEYFTRPADSIGMAGHFATATSAAKQKLRAQQQQQREGHGSGDADGGVYNEDGVLTADELSSGSHLRSSSPAPSNLDRSNNVPGDTFGSYETRQPFLRPVHRNVINTVDNVQFADLMPSDAPPLRCVAPEMLRRLSAKYSMTPKEVLYLMIDCEHDINRFLHHCERKLGKMVQPGDYGLVALESYDPECFCLANYCMPTFESTREEDRLEALHELTLSAAEIPLDTPRNCVVNTFRNGWATDGDENCRELLKYLDVSVRDIVLLPFGEYSSQGFFVASPPLPDSFPNIGTGAAAVCYDLRSGIHQRFRFHAERNADSLAEHLVREQMHFDQHYVHFLRQSFWFNPDFSVEDFIRYKESLLMPSATVFELRTAVMLHNLGGRSAYRNVAEAEKVKIAQHKLDKGGKEQAMAGSLFDSMGQSKVMGSMKSMTVNHYKNDGKDADNSREVTLENIIFDQAEIRVHAERIWSTFYRNNFF